MAALDPLTLWSSRFCRTRPLRWKRQTGRSSVGGTSPSRTRTRRPSIPTPTPTTPHRVARCHSTISTTTPTTTTNSRTLGDRRRSACLKVPPPTRAQGTIVDPPHPSLSSFLSYPPSSYLTHHILGLAIRSRRWRRSYYNSLRYRRRRVRAQCPHIRRSQRSPGPLSCSRPSRKRYPRHLHLASGRRYHAYQSLRPRHDQHQPFCAPLHRAKVMRCSKV